MAAMKLIRLLLSNNKSVIFSIWYTISYTTHIKQMTGEELLYQYLTFIMIPVTL